MPRQKGHDRRAVRLREDLDAAVLALVDGQEVFPSVQLRIRQAIERSGMSALLKPALDDLVRLANDVAEAKKHISAAGQQLTE